MLLLFVDKFYIFIDLRFAKKKWLPYKVPFVTL